MKKYLVHIIWVVVAIVAFVGGMYYAKASSSASGARGGFSGNFAGLASSTRGAFAGRGGGAAGGGVIGQVTSVDSDSITVQLANGNSEIVFYSSSTPITEPKTVPASSLVTGTSVVVGGTANSDGSFTAQMIQVRPSAGNSQ